jgi:hypothetical protein
MRHFTGIKSGSFLFLYLVFITPIFSVSGYLRYTEASWCMDDCSIYFLEDEYGEFLTWITHLDDISMLDLYTNRFVEIEGEEIWCVECGGIDVTSIELSDDCEFPNTCFVDPCGVETCPEYPEAECISNYCQGCWADFYLDGELLDCSVQTGCIDLAGIDFGDCDMYLGIGWITDHCESISGCSYIGENGVNYSSAFFNSMEVCNEECNNFTPDSVFFALEQGWNLVGLPVGVPNSSYQYLFPNAVEGTLFSFDGGYISEENLNPGKGYWLRFWEDETTIVIGNQFPQLDILLNEGWNLISGINQITDVNDIFDPINILVPGTFYGFNMGYEEAFQLVPGESYWVRSNQLGVIYINFN